VTHDSNFVQKIKNQILPRTASGRAIGKGTRGEDGYTKEGYRRSIVCTEYRCTVSCSALGTRSCPTAALGCFSMLSFEKEGGQKQCGRGEGVLIRLSILSTLHVLGNLIYTCLLPISSQEATRVESVTCSVSIFLCQRVVPVCGQRLRLYLWWVCAQQQQQLQVEGGPTRVSGRRCGRSWEFVGIWLLLVCHAQVCECADLRKLLRETFRVPTMHELLACCKSTHCVPLFMRECTSMLSVCMYVYACACKYIM